MNTALLSQISVGSGLGYIVLDALSSNNNDTISSSWKWQRTMVKTLLQTTAVVAGLGALVPTLFSTAAVDPNPSPLTPQLLRILTGNAVLDPSRPSPPPPSPPRLDFHSSLRQPILQGRKVATARLKGENDPNSDLHALLPGTMATATSNGSSFALLNITSIESICFDHISDALARLEGCQSAHELKTVLLQFYPEAVATTVFHVYYFKVVPVPKINPTSSTNYLVAPPLNLSGDTVQVHLTLSYLDNVLSPVVQDILQHHLNTQGHRQDCIFIGIAGGSGSGKTTLSQLLVRALNGLNIHSTTISMDNYHYTNEYLDQHMHSTRVDTEGNPMNLRAVKGRAETIDSSSMLQDLIRIAKQASQASQASQVSQAHSSPLLLPIYDRALHDPVPNRLAVPQSTRVVLVEGLHLLRDQEDTWVQIRSMFHSLYYLRFDEGKDSQLQKERVMQRRIRGGISREWASPRYDQVDAVMGAEIEQQAGRAVAHIEGGDGTKTRLTIMTMCEDTNGLVDLKRIQTYAAAAKVGGCYHLSWFDAVCGGVLLCYGCRKLLERG